MGSANKRDGPDITFWLIPPFIGILIGLIMFSKFTNTRDLSDGLLSVILVILGVGLLLVVGLIWIGNKINSLEKALAGRKE
uniref:Uncharacterized protein n=1 Tax=Thermosphaera aggregans TaxID=54254 RepID=A0A7C2FF75_9CREN